MDVDKIDGKQPRREVPVAETNANQNANPNANPSVNPNANPNAMIVTRNAVNVRNPAAVILLMIFIISKRKLQY